MRDEDDRQFLDGVMAHVKDSVSKKTFSEVQEALRTYGKKQQTKKELKFGMPESKKSDDAEELDENEDSEEEAEFDDEVRDAEEFEQKLERMAKGFKPKKAERQITLPEISNDGRRVRKEDEPQYIEISPAEYEVPFKRDVRIYDIPARKASPPDMSSQQNLEEQMEHEFQQSMEYPQPSYGQRPSRDEQMRIISILEKIDRQISFLSRKRQDIMAVYRIRDTKHDSGQPEFRPAPLEKASRFSRWRSGRKRRKDESEWFP